MCNLLVGQFYIGCYLSMKEWTLVEWISIDWILKELILTEVIFDGMDYGRINFDGTE